MEDEIKKRIPQIVEFLKNDYDVVIKKKADKGLKFLYYKPKNIRCEDE